MAEETYFATTARGVEEILAAELRRLGCPEPVVERGGVSFRGDRTFCYRANLWLRTASRVLLPVGEFPCATEQDLYGGVRELDWNSWLTPDMTLAVEASLRDSNLTHSGYVALKTKDAVVDAIRERRGRRPSVDTRDPDLRIQVRLFRNRCTVSLDTSGEPLDRRGYRLDRGEAPLRETLAAALVELTGWDGSVPLVDPLCGSGTIVIEAALRGLGRAPGLLRQRFGFQRWPDFDAERWRQVVAEAAAERAGKSMVTVCGRDRSSEAVATARRNGQRAGVDFCVNLAVADILSLEPPVAGPGVLLCNPPYGQRLGEVEALKGFYRQLGDALKQHWKGYTAYLFTGSQELAKEVGLRPSRRIVLFNGPIECRLLRYELY